MVFKHHVSLTFNAGDVNYDTFGPNDNSNSDHDLNSMSVFLILLGLKFRPGPEPFLFMQKIGLSLDHTCGCFVLLEPSRASPSSVISSSLGFMW